ncbi:MAG: hypothetical protein Q9184_005715 [Pyrenodesmia sp. 2 TL-2023]
MASSAIDGPMRVELPSSAQQSILGTYYDDSGAEDLPAGSTTTEDDVQSLVGVSISRVQTRLKSPTAPAAEKVAALNSLWGASFVDPDPSAEHTSPSHPAFQQETHMTTEDEHNGPVLDESIAPINWPTPWVSGPKLFETQPANPRQQEVPQPRDKPSPGTMANLVDLNVKRFMTSFAMSSSPRPPIVEEPSVPTLAPFSKDQAASPNEMQHRRAKPDMPQASQWSATGFDSAASGGTSRKGNDHGAFSAFKQDLEGLRRLGNSQLDGGLPDSAGGQHLSLQPTLKRTLSDQSLALRRATSIASSLGDDNRWEHVQKQVNSRAKAISDSLQDSRIKLPSLPSLPTVNLGSLRPDFLRNRARSDTIRPSWPLEPGHDGSPLSNGALLKRQGKVPQETFRLKESTFESIRPPWETDHPQLDLALDSLTGDVVLLGGYRGSILRSAKPPHRQLWVPIKVGLNIRKVNLEVGLAPEDEEKMEETIIPSGMLSHIGPIDMGRRLLKRIKSCQNAQEGKLRVHDYGYDWRLSPHLLSSRLVQYLKQLPSNAHGVQERQKGAVVIAHSLGGLITRHAVNQCPELFAGVIYAGVPQHCVNILGPLRKGDEVLLSSKVLTAQVNFTFRTSFLLLPENGRCFIDKKTKEEYQVDFFDPTEWKRYALSPCIAPASPPFLPQERKGLLSFIMDNLPSLPLVERMPISDTRADSQNSHKSAQVDIDPHLDSQSLFSSSSNVPQSTIPIPQAEEYLTRTLAEVVQFKKELKFIPQCAEWNTYPPLSIMYSDSVPTVYRARVASRAAIKCSDAYDDLTFASGDGVCLAKAAMLPKGYEYSPGGKIKTERGHVGLLGDLEAVGRCLLSVIKARRKGVGLGPGYRNPENSNQS